MKAALVVTTLNEGQTIGALLEAVATQSRQPDEILIVDGGSTDGTLATAQTYKARLPGLRLLEAPGRNISQGRNRGVAATHCPLIAVTDAGCQPDPDWLAHILAPLETNPAVGLVSGAVQPDPANPFEACVGPCSMAYRMHVGEVAFFPTARSLAFHRKLWATVDGFPEELDFGEDAAFIFAAAAAGAALQVVPQAVVRWRPRGSYGEVVCQFYHYAEGLARAGLSRNFHLRTVVQSVGGFACLAWGLTSCLWRAWKPVLLPWALLALLTGAYLVRKARQGCFAAPGWRMYYRVPLVLAAIHLGTMAGVITGNWRRLRAR